MSHPRDSIHTLVLNSSQRPPAAVDFGPQLTRKRSKTVLANMTIGDRSPLALPGARGDLR
jgi:hypothetical protein